MVILYVSRKKLFLFAGLLIISVISLIIAVSAYDRVITVMRPQREIPIYCVDTTEKKISITFDCAWGADDIPDILETLNQEGIRATFFLVGKWAEKNPRMVKLMHQHGHDVGNHSYSHLKMSTIGRDRIKAEIEKCNNTLASLTGAKTDLFRAPYGDYNNLTVSVARELGCYTIQWDVDSLDWKPEITPESIISRVINKTKPGSILLFHNDTKHTAEVLPVILQQLKSKGFTFVPVSELIYRDNFFIDHDGTQRIKK